MSKTYVAKYRGHTASVYEQDGRWRVNPVVMPDGRPVEMDWGKCIGRTAESEKSFESLIDRTALTDMPFDSLEKAKSAANKQLEYFVDETFDAEWKEEC